MPKANPEPAPELSLSKIEAQAPETVTQSGPVDFWQMLAGVIKHDIPPDKIDAVERLTAMAMKQQERNDARRYADAFARLQADVKRVKAQHAVEAKDGTIKYRVVKFHELMNEVEPLLRKHGFTIEWSQTYPEDKMTVICTLGYLGYKSSHPFTARVGTGPPNSTAYQADGACETYCKGRALRAALNITIEAEDSDDPRGLGEPITKEQADDIRKRVQASGADETKFLAWAGAESYEKIMSGRYADIDDNLRRKERTTRPKQ